MSADQKSLTCSRFCLRQSSTQAQRPTFEQSAPSLRLNSGGITVSKQAHGLERCLMERALPRSIRCRSLVACATGGQANLPEREIGYAAPSEDC
eukprot:4166334-Amphidinium_carterae.1